MPACRAHILITIANRGLCTSPKRGRSRQHSSLFRLLSRSPVSRHLTVGHAQTHDGRANRGDHRHVEHHRAAAPPDRNGRVGHRLRGHRVARLHRSRRRAAHADRHRRQQHRRARQGHVGAHPRRRALPHAADDRRRQGRSIPARRKSAPSFDSLLTTSDLERVEVLRGPQGFIYGADAGGVVNVHDEARRRRFRRPGRARVRRVLDCARSTPRLSGGGDRGRLLRLGHRFRDGRFQRADGGHGVARRRRCRQHDAAREARLERVRRRAPTARRARHRCRDRVRRLLPVTFATVHDCLGTTEQTTYKVSADIASGDFTNSFGYSNVDIVRDNFTQGCRRSRPKASSAGSSTRAATSLRTRSRSSTASISRTRSSSRRQRAEPRQKGYYVEYQGAFDDAFFLSLGARYDDNDDFGSHTSARLSLAYVQDIGGGRSLKYRGSVGTGFRAPSMFEIAYNTGPFAFPPAAGARARRGGRVRATTSASSTTPRTDSTSRSHISIRRSRTKSFSISPAFSGYLQSPGTSTSKGIEIAADVPLGERWELLANWTNNDAENSTDAQRLRRPKNLGNFGVLYRAGKSAAQLHRELPSLAATRSTSAGSC